MTFTDFSITIPGKYHRDRYINCQDHAFVDSFQDLHIGVVSDGVGALDYAEFASLITASGTIKYLKTLKNYDKIENDVYSYILNAKTNCLKYLREKERRMAYAATLLFYVVTPRYSWVYAQGDGYYGINKQIFEVKGNAKFIEECTLELMYKGKTEDIDNIWVSTDGMYYSKKIQQYMINGEHKAGLFDLIEKEHHLNILDDDFGIASLYRI